MQNSCWDRSFYVYSLFFFSNGKETKGCSLNEIWIQIIWSHFREIAYFSILCKPYHIVRLESIGLKDLLYYNHPFYINSRHPHSQPHYATHNNILAILFEKYFLQHQGSHNHRSKCLLKVLKKILHKGYIKNNIKFDSQRQKFYLFFDHTKGICFFAHLRTLLWIMIL